MHERDYADYRFTVKEGEASRPGANDAPPSVMCEPRTRELTIVGDRGFLSINPKRGTSVAKAQEIAAYLKEHVQDVSFTRLR